jgi:hypothetical protein
MIGPNREFVTGGPKLLGISRINEFVILYVILDLVRKKYTRWPIRVPLRIGKLPQALKFCLSPGDP